jgi:hypothetical protein
MMVWPPLHKRPSTAGLKNAPHFLLTFGDAMRPPVGAVIIEAPSIFQARVTAVVRHMAPGVPFGEGLMLSSKLMTAIPPEEVGRMMSGLEAAELILHLVRVAEGHGHKAMIVP